MSQAARCPNCRTVFRVQPQQLQASGGWARCGQCGEVFNALQALVAVPTMSPAPGGTAAASAPAATPARPAAPGAQDSPWAGPGPAGRAGAAGALDHNPPPVSSLYRRAEPGTGSAAPPAAAPATPDTLPPPRSRPREDTVLPAEPAKPATPAPVLAPAWTDVPASVAFPVADTVPAATPVAELPPAPPSPVLPARDAEVAAAGQPSFLQAPAPARDTTDTQRTWWAAAATLLVLTGLLQALLIARPTLSASFPAARPLLQPLCALTRCNAEAAPRHLAALAVESSALSRLSGNDRHYRLSLLLRNRDTQALRWPAVELRLTDAQGVLLVRKVLRARELGADVAAIPAGRELPLQAVLDMGEQPVAGYSVELFYP